MSLSNTSFDAMLQMLTFTAFLLGFFWGGASQLLSLSEDWSVSDWKALTEKYNSSGIYTYHTWYWRNRCCSVSWGRGKSDKNIAFSCGYMNRCLIIYRRKSEWHYESNKLEDQNTKVYFWRRSPWLLVISLQQNWCAPAGLEVQSRRFEKARSSSFVREDWKLIRRKLIDPTKW